MVKGMARFVPTIFAMAAFALPASAAVPLDLQDSWRIGTEGNALCTAQIMASDDALQNIFDRGYSVVCRDAAVPVGQLYALRTRTGDPSARLAKLRLSRASCGAREQAQVADLGQIASTSCRLNEADVGYRVYSFERGGTLYVAEGLAGYEAALQLGLRSLVANRIVAGEVSVATTGADDPGTFARVLAGSISPQRALAEAYRRNNSGNYAEAAEFFATLGSSEARNDRRPEALANQAVQKSNLGSYAEAEMLFDQAEALVNADPVVERQLRNYRAMHFLNQGRLAEVYAELARPVGDAGASTVASINQLVIDSTTAAQLSAETAAARRLGANEGLTPQDRAQILDAQAQQIRGSALLLEDKQAEAIDAFTQAQTRLTVVREGRVAATQWMQAQILAELADISESNGDMATAEARHQEGVALVQTHYPGSSILLSAKGELAAFYARTGRIQQALAAFGEIVDISVESGVASPSLRRTIGSYFALLTGPNAPATAAADMFRASQLLVRPGVAQTQAVLARGLGGGSDEAANLFRQSVNLTREVERGRIELNRLEAQGSGADPARIQTVRAALEQAQLSQVATQAELARFPRYLAVSNARLSLPDLQAALRPDEAYYKMVVVGGGAYALFVRPQGANAYRIGATAGQLEREVDGLRATISAEENGQLVTYPFDVEGAHRLYQALLGPVATELAGVRSLIFEPDGAMLRLPPNLLVMDQASVQNYKARASRPGDDGFDLTGISWLGRDRDISTAVSPRAFRDLRQAAPSKAATQYIGFGQNRPADAFFLPTASVANSDPCSWSLAAWGRPISAGELKTASRVLGVGEAAVVTEEEFTDAAIKNRNDLDQYRIVHFATHGMLSPPRPECPARPALMTSFGGPGSDGLLSFGEIYDLKLDADVVILSACDTAGRGSAAANREAGITGGGDFALDGLVRAFVGAGGRLVIASHWPVPDDFNATQRLISGLFESAPGTSTASALRAAQHKLMDDPMTSHPFYWSAFALVGDGSAALIQPTQTASLN